MGVMPNLFSSCSCKPVIPNPNPENYTIREIVEVDKYTILVINYPDCTNYEGNKVLVYYDINKDDILNADKIDPHFCENCKISPIARFEPTDIGVEMALSFVNSIKEL